MDDWATSSPWAETTNDDDDFDDFQSSPPATSNGKKGAPEAAVGGSATNGFTPFKVEKESFGNGWGFEHHETPHDTSIGGGWHPEDPAFVPNGTGLVTSIEEDKLKPAKGTWEYKNEWAKSQESLAPSESSNIWNKSDDWSKPELALSETAREPQGVVEDVAAPEPVKVDNISAPTISVPTVEDVAIKGDWEKTQGEDDVPLPSTQLEESPPTEMKPELSQFEVKDDIPTPTPKSPAISPGDDFGDFEEEDDSLEAIPPPVEATPPVSRPISMDLRSGTVDPDHFVVGSLSALDNLYRTKPRQLPASSATELISTTSQRKTWYKLVRKESARNSIQGEDVLRVRWSGSETQKKVHDIVKRWISEDRMSGRAVLGGGVGAVGMFDWNSNTPGTRSNPISPAQSTFPAAPKPRIDPSKRSSITGPPTTSPRSPSFGWSSAQSPQSPSFGWTNNDTVPNPKPTSETPRRSSFRSIHSPSASSFPTPPTKQPTTKQLGHVVRSSVDIPRTKPVLPTNRPTSMLVESNTRSLFGELAAMKSPPAVTSPKTAAPPLAASEMDFSIFEDKKPEAPVQSQADTSFDDDFGDFEDGGFQAPSPPPMQSTFSNVMSQPRTHPPKSISPPLASPKPPASTNSAGLFFESNSTPASTVINSPMQSPLGLQSLGSSAIPKQPAAPLSKPADDPWGSFDIFDAPKPSQPVVQQAKRSSVISPLSSPPAHKSTFTPSNGTKSPPLSTRPPSSKPAQPSLKTATGPPKPKDEFDDWGEMVDTPSLEVKKVDWPTSKPVKPAAAPEAPQNRVNRSSTLDIFSAPSAPPKLKTGNPAPVLDIFSSPVSSSPVKTNIPSSTLDFLASPTSTVSAKHTPSPLSIPNIPPTIPATPSPSVTNFFSSNVLVPQRVATPPISSHPSSTRNSIDLSRKNTPVPRNDSFASLSTLGSLAVKKDESLANKRFSTPILPTQQQQLQAQIQKQPPKPAASPQPTIASPLSAEWNDADFGFFEEATPAPEPKPVTSIKGHRPTASLGSINTKTKDVAKASVTMSPIVGKRDEEVGFAEIIDLLPDLGYMLR
ncbi:hypothetical protein ABW19_dt0208473 [Dactylella cylindrospora]|nr:hypothetical protein ABW19_dt0208473 [Dactylella cylindrospora]